MTPRSVITPLVRWFDSDYGDTATTTRDGVDWVRVVPFIGMHLMCFGILWVGWSPVAVVVATLLYLVRMFAITGFYHRYFSHRSFKTSRVVQFLFAVIGAASVQRGPIWWAAHHRHHHRYSDTERDPHSPVVKGFWRSHMGWFLTREGFRPNLDVVRDLRRFPELRFLDRFDVLVPIVLAVGLFYFGKWLHISYPELGTTGAQMLIWGFFVSTVVLFHATVTINSLAHVVGRRRYATRDESRNNWLLALITLGEGWHNNHHHYPSSTRQGFYWWELDLTYAGLKVLSWLGLVRDMKRVPDAVRRANRIA